MRRGVALRGLTLAMMLAAGCATLPPPPAPPADWVAHRVCGIDSRPRRGESYCLELIEIGEGPQRPRAVALLVPGMFQNAWSFDLLPESEVSFARFLQSRGVKSYVVHVRGIGASDHPRGSGLDDIVIDDLPRALEWVAERAGEPVIVIGQSQGSMTLKAMLAGLTRCVGGPCFDPEVASVRQRHVRSAGFFAGNVALTGSDPRLAGAGCAGQVLRGPLIALGRVRSRRLAVRAYHEGWPAFGLWEVLSRDARVGEDARRAVVERTVDSTSGRIAAQFADGIAHGSVRSGEQRWTDHLVNIRVPVVQTTFGSDVLSEPMATWRDDFQRIGSEKKRFKRVDGQAHEDWMMSAELHAQHWMTVEELVEGF